MNEQLKHYQDKLNYEIDSWDLDVELKSGDNITVIDARNADTFQQEHIPGAVNLPHMTMTPETTSHIHPTQNEDTFDKSIVCGCG